MILDRTITNELSGPAPADDRVSGERSTKTAVVVLVLATLALTYAGFQLLQLRQSRDNARTTAEQTAVSEVKFSAASVDTHFREIAESVDMLAALLSSGDIDDGLELRRGTTIGTTPGLDRPLCADADAGLTELEFALCGVAAQTPELNGVGVLFDPAVDPKTEYRPYALRIAGPLELTELAPRDPLSTDFYVNAVQNGGDWGQTYFGPTSGELLFVYSTPFYGQDGALRGVLMASYTLDQLADNLQLLSQGANGYSIILSSRGDLVSHPDASRIAAAFSSQPPPPHGMVATLREALLSDPDGSGLEVNLHDEVTGTVAWLAYEPIPSTDWTLASVVLEREVVDRTVAQSRHIIQASMAVLIALLLAEVVVFRVHRGSQRGLWAMSTTAGLFALVGIGVVWFLANTGPIGSGSQLDVPVGRSDVVAGEAEPLFAGVFVQSIEFTGANDVTVSGIAWQEQRSDVPGDSPPGFVLPEADHATFSEQYRQTIGNLTRVGWSFTASLRQAFDYSRYPLDGETVWLRLWPADYGTASPLIPDLSSYVTLAPSTRPGIERDFVVEGWTLEAASYSYRANEYNTDFGVDDRAGSNVTELYFNVHLRRSFLQAMMSELIPIAVVAMLLFAVLMVATPTRTVREDSDFSPISVLGYCAALFFVVIISHTNLREKLQAQQLIYLEYFYFAAYAAILGVSVTAILIGAGRGLRLIGYRNNNVPALLFWPLLNTGLLLVTLIAFY